jgi:hypothetical protein
MLAGAACLSLALAATSTRAMTPEEEMNRFMPCSIGLTVEYRDEPKEGEKGAPLTMTETIRGPGKEPRTCVIDRLVIKPDGAKDKDAWVREMLSDRIANAGWIDRMVAFRTPLLRTPIRAGRKWHFNTTDFEIKSVGDTYDVPAGTFEGCIRVTERSTDGAHEAYSIYAPGVGLILYESKAKRVRAVKVTMPNAHENAHDGAANDKPPVRKTRKKRIDQETPKTSR